MNGELRGYDSLIDENPEIQERVARGEIRGEIQGLQQLVLEAVKEEYPPLEELAQERVMRVTNPTLLRYIVKQIFKAPDEATARWVLDTLVA